MKEYYFEDSGDMRKKEKKMTIVYDGGRWGEEREGE